MRLRVFSARTVGQAMDRVRLELGPEAVIVHIDEGGGAGPVRVTAAIEAEVAPAIEAAPPHPAVSTPMAPMAYDGGLLAATLRYHGIPSPLATRLQTHAAAYADESLTEALARAIETLIPPLPLAPPRPDDVPLVLVGSPGQGKTLAAARLAMAARLAGQEARVITLDATAAGAREQLQGFCAPLEISVIAADSPATLENHLHARYKGATIIDTAGINPYSLNDIEPLAHILKRSGGEPLWVLAAGADVLEAAELAEVFASLGVRRLIATRLDAHRRLGALVTATARAKLALTALSSSPYVADLLHPATPSLIADLLLSKPDPARTASTHSSSTSRRNQEKTNA